MGYKQLTERERIIIWAMRKNKRSQAEIARAIGCHRSTVSRELKRNTTLAGYDAHKAQSISEERKHHCRHKEYSDYQTLIAMLQNFGWSVAEQKSFILRHHPELSADMDKIFPSQD